MRRSGESCGEGTGDMTLRCLLDGLLLPARLIFGPGPPALLAFDGDEGFTMEAVEALYYELVAATPDEVLGLEKGRYRLLRRAEDFHQVLESRAEDAKERE